VSFNTILLRIAPAATLALALALAGCAAGPDYVRPDVAMPAAYKEAAEAGPWKPAQPSIAGADRAWWSRYGDSRLDALVGDANAANQDIRIAEAQYRQARAAAQLARAAFAPSVGAGFSAERARSHSASGSTLANSGALALDASWEPDLWGRVRRAAEAGAASAQASAADLAAARLTIQAELVQDYLQLRINDAQRALIERTTQGYEKALALTRSQYRAGVATQADVALAETTLQSARAQGIDLGVSRSQLEHAIAILTGRAPSALTIAPLPGGEIGVTLPDTPAGLPSALLERRPDIAAAERRAAAANAGIGVAQAAYFPSLTLSASGGIVGASIAQLANAPARIWSLGAELAQTLFDGGARRARTEQALAAYDASAAQYKRTVLAGLQEVEDNLAALRILGEERGVQDAAVASARTAERVSLAQYRAGTASFLSVVTAQNLALTNERNAVLLLGRQLAASAALVRALGGGWDAATLGERQGQSVAVASGS
jgi:NodT family efflux transporter outer membrane factor (OMF) lipoprotein